MEFVTTTDVFSTFVGTPISLQFAGNVTAGSLLLAHIYVPAGVATTGVSDDVNGAWTLAHADQWNMGSLYFFLSTAGGSAPTVSVTLTSSSPTRMTISEIKPTSGSTWTGKEASDHAGANSQDHLCASPAITSTNANGIWIAGLSCEGTFANLDSGEVTTNYTQTTVTDTRERIYYRIATATETSDADYHTTVVLQDFSLLAYFYETAGGGPPANDARIIIAPA